MTTSISVLQKEFSAQEALQKLLREEYYVKDTIVVDDSKRLYGIVPRDGLLCGLLC